MIYLYQNQNNQAAAVCSRNATLNNPVFLWKMVHKLSNEEYRFIPFRILPDVSYKPSYDMFCIDIDDSIPEVLTGTTSCGQTNVHLIPGEYSLEVYQQVSNSNLDPSQSSGLVYQTLVNMVGTNQNIPVTYSGESNNYVIYDPDNNES
jgi:hypothetical protein